MIGTAKFILIGSWQLAQNKALRKALHEATVDTAIGAIIMFPLSVGIIKACIDYAGTSSEMAAFINFLGLTGIAIVRKALVRLRFSKWDQSSLLPTPQSITTGNLGILSTDLSKNLHVTQVGFSSCSNRALSVS